MHWREFVFGEELMSSTFAIGETQALSVVTVQALADLGYVVDVSQADDYSLPPAGKPVAAAATGSHRCQVLRLPPGVQQH